MTLYDAVIQAFITKSSRPDLPMKGCDGYSIWSKHSKQALLNSFNILLHLILPTTRTGELSNYIITQQIDQLR